jgi:hypothetical protein
MTRLGSSIGSQVQYKARRCYNAGLDLPCSMRATVYSSSGALRQFAADEANMVEFLNVKRERR